MAERCGGWAPPAKQGLPAGPSRRVQGANGGGTRRAGHGAQVRGGNPAPSEPVRVARDGGEPRELAASTEGKVVVLVPTGESVDIGFPRLDEEPGPAGGGKPARKAVAGAIEAKAGKTLTLRAGKQHVVQLPARRDVMTIGFALPAAPEGEFPRFVLTSDDGSYRAEQGPKDDLVEGDDRLDLCFGGLRAGPRYRLVRHDGPGEERLVFDDLPYSVVVDQRRHRGAESAAEVAVLEGAIGGDPAAPAASDEEAGR